MKTYRATVLVVDDDPSVREATRDVLEHFGFGVVTAADGRQGLDVFYHHRPQVDAVMLDLFMPVLDGEAVYVELRRSHPSLPVIIVSANAWDGIRERLAHDPHGHFLDKPYRLDDLVGTVTSAIDRQAA